MDGASLECAVVFDVVRLVGTYWIGVVELVGLVDVVGVAKLVGVVGGVIVLEIIELVAGAGATGCTSKDATDEVLVGETGTTTYFASALGEEVGTTVVVYVEVDGSTLRCTVTTCVVTSSLSTTDVESSVVVMVATELVRCVEVVVVVVDEGLVFLAISVRVSVCAGGASSELPSTATTLYEAAFLGARAWSLSDDNGRALDSKAMDERAKMVETGVRRIFLVENAT